jgi:predicted transcriptional regulator
MVTRRLPRELWTRLHNHVASIQPRTTDTAIMELAIQEYLDRHEKKGK